MFWYWLSLKDLQFIFILLFDKWWVMMFSWAVPLKDPLEFADCSCFRQTEKNKAIFIWKFALWRGTIPRNTKKYIFLYILNISLFIFLSRKLKNNFFIVYINFFRVNFRISLDLHMKYEQNRQWRGFGSTKVTHKIKKDWPHHELYR